MGGTLEREACGAKKVRKLGIKQIEFLKFFLLRFVCFFIRSGGDGASTHLEETRFRMEGIAFSACAPFCAQRRRRKFQDKLPTKTRPDGEAKNKRQSIIETRRNREENCAFWGRKSSKNLAGSSFRWQPGANSVLGGSRGRFWRMFGYILAPKPDPETCPKPAKF